MNDTFIKACRGEKTPYTPIWIMRQAGRYMPEYQRIRDKVDFLTLCKTPELAAEVTLQPVDILGVDAAILFSDILIPLEPMGLKLEFSEKIGPVIHNPITTRKALTLLRPLDPLEDVAFVRETIKILKDVLKVPLIGFSGAPFTLATYAIEGGSSKNFVNIKKILYSDREFFEEIIDKLTDMVTNYLIMQIKAGVDAVQIFDTWLGILPPEYISSIVSRYVAKIIDKIKNISSVPIIYFPFGCGASLTRVADSGANVIGLDWRVDIDEATSGLGKDLSVQGNLDPCVLFGTQEVIVDKVRQILKGGKGARGHIFNLGHGILPETPVDNVKYLIDKVHEISSKEVL